MGAKRKVLPKTSERKSFPSPKWKPGKTALVTGASSGIGYDLCKILARDGYNLVLVARNKSKLRELASDMMQMHDISVKVLPKDLSVPEASNEIYHELEKLGIRIDLLVNNAGIGTFGLFHETDLKEKLKIIQINVTAVAHLTRLFLPEMVMRREGKILNVASTAAFQPGPLMANYYASKSYVISLSVALAEELRGTGVTVSVLCPGPTRTAFHRHLKMEDSGLMRLPFMNSEKVARIGYEGLKKGKVVIIPGEWNRFWAWAGRVAPLTFAALVVRLLQKRRKREQ